MDFTAIAAWFGAIVSTIGIALKAVELHQNNARLKVKIQTEHYGDREYDDYIVTVHNTGRRTVTIQAIYVGTPDNYSSDMDEDLLPFELPEGKSAIFKYHKNGLKPEQIRYVMVVDAADRIWSGKLEWRSGQKK